MTVRLPASVPDALARLATEPDLVPIAGATDLLVHWPAQLDRHTAGYLDLTGLAELRPLRWDESSLVLGGLTTYWDVITEPRVAREFPLLEQAARTVGAVQIQARGTWAGNIVNASPAADGVPVLMAYDADVELQSTRGTERVALADFYLGYKVMRRTPDQLVTAIHLPRRAYAVQIFEKVGSRAAQAITKVGLAVTRSEAGWRVVVNSMAPTVRRCPTIEHMLENEIAVRRPEDLTTAIRADTSPIDDIRSTAPYRTRVLGRVLYHHLRDVCPWVQ